MGPNILELSKFCCFICCFSVVLYLTVKDLKRYLDNDDTTVIEFKRFNASPEDKYPVITLCFHGKYCYVFSGLYFKMWLFCTTEIPRPKVKDFWTGLLIFL